jgi:hypothetical protein
MTKASVGLVEADARMRGDAVVSAEDGELMPHARIALR